MANKLLLFLKYFAMGPFVDTWRGAKVLWRSLSEYADNFNKPSFTATALAYLFIGVTIYSFFIKQYNLAVIAFIALMVGYGYYIWERGDWRREYKEKGGLK